MDSYIYDVECFRNLFTVIFVNSKDENEQYTFTIGFGKNDTDAIKAFLDRRIMLVGYNNHSYDDPMLRYIQNYIGPKDKLTLKLYNLSKMLINDSYRNDPNIRRLRYYTNKYKWYSIDLMAILGFNKMGISLKQTAINLKWHKIQDIPLDPEEDAPEEEYNTILKYNLNDVLITKRLYEEIEPIRKLRNNLSRLYNVNLTSASDSKVANILLEKIYTKEAHVDIESIKDLKTPRDKLHLKECVASFVKFKTPQLNELLNRISARIVYSTNRFKYSEELYYANCEFSLGVGGLHTKDSPGKFYTDDEYIIQDMDVASYYPNLIINNNFYPEHLGLEFIDVLKKITDERIEAKRNGDKIKADGLKITINSIFGKLGYEYFWLYDPKQFISTTINGQLGLLMLVEGMHENGIEVISANTDGVVCKIPRELEDKYYKIAHAWEDQTGLELEFTEYKKYIRRDVNSYITEKQDGKVKEKGAFVTRIELMKSYTMPIVPKAIREYFINDVPVIETLENCKDIMEFCISQKTGSNFQVEYHTSDGVELQQKTNRFYVSNSGGSLVKRDKRDESRVIGMYVGNYVRMLNDYDSKAPFEEYDVNLNFYKEEVMKIIDEIEPPQMSLF
jgi:DNA polymerase elongation subunit (family B)